MNILFILLLIEIIPLVYIAFKLIFVISDIIYCKKETILNRCVYDKEYRNKIASMLFFFADMGPNISSFSVIALFITTEEKWNILTVIFFFGIIMKELFRKLKNKFYGEIEKRSS